jgi:hypothetical protein
MTHRHLAIRTFRRSSAPIQRHARGATVYNPTAEVGTFHVEVVILAPTP